MITAMTVRLRTTDLVAHSTGELLQRMQRMPGSLATVDRRTAWLCEWAAAAAKDAALAALVRPGVLYNPNKESLSLADDVAALVCPAGPRDAIVATWPHDREADVTVRGILRRAGCDTRVLARAWCVTLWGLRAGDAATSLAAFAAEVAEVRGRGHGVLANPHLTSSAVLSAPLTLRDLIEIIAPSLAPAKGVSA